VGLRKIIIYLICFSIFSACTPYTKKLWNKSSQYKENIDSFMVSEDGKILVVIGETYHYIFDLNAEFKAILLSEYRPKLKPVFYGFQVDETNGVSGTVSLSYVTDNKHVIDRLKRDGFKRDGSWRAVKRFVYSGKLIGNRYVSDKRINKKIQFSTAYTVRVKETPTISDYVEKILKTPVTVLADGVIVIFGTVTLVAVGTMCAMKNGCR